MVAGGSSFDSGSIFGRDGAGVEELGTEKSPLM